MFKGLKEVKDAAGKLTNEVADKLKGGPVSVSFEKSHSKMYKFSKYGTCEPKELSARMVTWQCALFFWKVWLVSHSSRVPYSTWGVSLSFQTVTRNQTPFLLNNIAGSMKKQLTVP